MDGVQLHHQECREDETEELYPPLSADESTKQPDDARIDYRQGAEAPVVSVRLQEGFGLTDTPTVNDGKQPLLMELLSPGFKPVQLTKDLRNFWQETYFEVRKELRRRYPKHSWPDDPLTAPATRTIQRTANSSSSKLT